MDLNKKIRRFIESNLLFFHDEAVFSDGDNILEMGLVNSLFPMKLLNYIKKEFNIKFDSDELEVENFTSVNNISTLIKTKFNNQ